jgi:hypothetical protein
MDIFPSWENFTGAAECSFRTFYVQAIVLLSTLRALVVVDIIHTSQSSKIETMFLSAVFQVLNYLLEAKGGAEYGRVDDSNISC